MARNPRQLMRQGAADLPTRGHVLAYVGPNGEIISDGETLRLQDGVTPGGIPLARGGRRAIADQNDQVVPSDAYLGITHITEARTLTLPPASAFQVGQTLYIADESGLCSEERPIIVVAHAGQTISGQASTRITAGYQKIALHSDGGVSWNYAYTPTPHAAKATLTQALLGTDDTSWMTPAKVGAVLGTKASTTDAAADATAKANTAQAAAIAAAATDATAKANIAKADAIAAAATDATTKAGSAQTNAISTVRGGVATSLDTLGKVATALGQKVEAAALTALGTSLQGQIDAKLTSTGDGSGLKVAVNGGGIRVLSDRHEDGLNALDFMLPTDSNAAVWINRAIARAATRSGNLASPGGGVVYVPNLGQDLTLTQPIVMKGGVQFVGLGRPRLAYDSTTIRAAIISEQFDTIYGTGSRLAGDEHMLVDNFHIYGKWESLPAFDWETGWRDSQDATDYANPAMRRDGIALYGRCMQVRNLWIERCRGNGMHFAYGNQGSKSPFDGHITNVTMHRLGEHGLINDCDDVHIQDINISTASRARHNGFCNILAKSGFHATNINLWTDGGQAFRPKYALWFAGGGGSEYIGGTVESGCEGGVRIDVPRVVFDGRAHSTAGWVEYEQDTNLDGSLKFFSPPEYPSRLYPVWKLDPDTGERIIVRRSSATFIVNGSRAKIKAVMYQGSQSQGYDHPTENFAGNGEIIAPLKLGGAHPVLRNKPGENPLVIATSKDHNDSLPEDSSRLTYRPQYCEIEMQVSQYTAPIDLSDSVGYNHIKIRGEQGRSYPESDGRQAKTSAVFSGTSQPSDTLDAIVGGVSPSQIRADVVETVAAVSGSGTDLPELLAPNVVANTATAGFGVRLSPTFVGGAVRVWNRGPGALNVYPHASGGISGLASGSPASLAANKGATFVLIPTAFDSFNRVTATGWTMYAA